MIESIRKISILFIVLLFIKNENNAQNYKDGLFFDVNIMFVNEHVNENIIYSVNPLSRELKKFDDRKLVLSCSFGFSGKINLSKVISLNYRPGLTISNGYWGFLDFGTSIRFQLMQKYFTGIGLVSKLTIKPREGNMNYTKAKNESFEYVLYLGYDLSKDFSVILSYSDTINNEYGVSYSSSGMSSTYISKYVYGMLKFGLEYKL